MPDSHFPDLIRSLPKFEGPFDAMRLAGDGCEVLFASYPSGTVIEPHTHPTRNCGVITKGELLLTVNGIEGRYGPGDWYRLDVDQERAIRIRLTISDSPANAPETQTNAPPDAPAEDRS